MERAAARIDLDAVRANCARLVEELGETELCAVVKADGYGHGAVECARAGREATARVGLAESVIATDVIAAIPAALRPDVPVE